MSALPFFLVLPIIFVHSAKLNLRKKRRKVFTALGSPALQQLHSPRVRLLGLVLYRTGTSVVSKGTAVLPLHSPAEQKQRQTNLSDFEDTEASSKYTSYARANSNCLASLQTITTQTTSRRRVSTHSDARGVVWHAGTSSASKAVHLPITPKSRLAQNFFFTRGFVV